MSRQNVIEVRLINARDLIAGDTNGFSDPFVKVELEGDSVKVKKGERTYKTQVRKKTLSPEWDEVAVFRLENPETSFLKLTVYDEDLIGKDFLGFVVLTLNNLEENKEHVDWYNLSNVASGKIQVGLRARNFSTIKNNSTPMPYYQPVPLSAPVWVGSYVNSNAPPSYGSPGYPPQQYGSPSMVSQAAPGLRESSRDQLQLNSFAQGFNITFNEIRLDKKIGVGAFGEVWKGEWAGTPVAIKKILKNDISEADLAEFSKEIMLMSKLRHPNIVQFLGACVEPFCLLTEFMDYGCLFNVLEDPAYTMDWALKLHIVTDIAKGIYYLHSRNPPIIHRDIKSLNVLVNSDWKCTIADFGLTKIKDRAMLQTKCGSPAWSAPEVLRGESYNEKADVFSYGIVLWEVYTREHPYFGISPQQLIGLIGYQKPGLRPPIPRDCPSPVLITLMTQCWDNDPNLRPDFAQILEILKTVQL